MEEVRQNFTAIYAGGCYVPAYGRKHYKQGVRLRSVSKDGMELIAEISVNKNKALDSLTSDDVGKTIAFNAVMGPNTLKYISDVRVVV